jgi:hypothetical protein
LIGESLSRSVGQGGGQRPGCAEAREAFAKVKTSIRKAAPRTLDAINNEIAKALNAIPPNECANDLKGAGYASI